MNLYEETMDKFQEIGKTVNDIDWIAGQHYRIPVNLFFNIARNTYYDSGYGLQEVAHDLVIVFNDHTWLERAEYDGREWWEYKFPPVLLIGVQNDITKLSSEYGGTVKSINEMGE